jgi:hypothetical protein
MYRSILTCGLVALSLGSYAGVNCEAIVGKWSGEIYNYEMQYRDTFFYEYKPEGTFAVTFSSQSLDGSSSNKYVDEDGSRESGVWKCKNGNLITVTKNVNGNPVDGSKKVYKLKLLDEIRMTYVTIVGYAPGLTYELYRED